MLRPEKRSHKVGNCHWDRMEGDASDFALAIAAVVVVVGAASAAVLLRAGPVLLVRVVRRRLGRAYCRRDSDRARLPVIHAPGAPIAFL